MTKHTQPDKSTTPGDADIERWVLGAVLLNGQKAMGVVMQHLPGAEVFTEGSHREIFAACLRLFGANKPIDQLSVKNELASSGRLDMAGGLMYLLSLADNVTNASNLSYHCRIVHQKSMLRDLRKFGEKLDRMAAEPDADPFDIAEHHIGGFLASMLSGVRGNKSATAMTLLGNVMESMEEKARKLDLGLPAGHSVTGIAPLDRHITIEDTDFIVLAGRPAMGKTALALAWAVGATRQCAGKNEAVHFFSYEMGKEQLMGRIMTQLAKMDNWKIKYPNVMNAGDWDSLMNLYNMDWLNNLVIHEASGMTPSQIRAALKVEQDRGKTVRLAVIDYIQLVPSEAKNGTRENEVSYITRSVKSMCQDLHIPVLGLSQLSRAVEGRGEKKPLLSDLRESGSIEQDSDKVLFVYRPEYYGVMQDESGNSTAGLMEVPVAKHRNGATHNGIRLRFIGSTQEIMDWDSPPISMPF